MIVVIKNIPKVSGLGILIMFYLYDTTINLRCKRTTYDESKFIIIINPPIISMD